MTTSLLLGLAIVVAAPGPKDAPKKDEQNLVGVWIVESTTQGGNQEKAASGATLEFLADGKMMLKERASEIKGTYASDPKKDPPELDLKMDVAGKSTALAGIFKFDGDTLTICMVHTGDRPKKFESPDKSPNILMILNRAKKD